MSYVETLQTAHKERMRRFDAAAWIAPPPPAISVPISVEKPESQVIQQLRAEIVKWRRKYEALKQRLPQEFDDEAGPEPAAPTPVTIQHIKMLVAETYQVDVALIDSDRRGARVVRPRHVAIHLAVRHTRNSMPAIARHFGGRDHTTILHADRRIAALRKDDPVIDAELRLLESRLGV